MDGLRIKLFPRKEGSSIVSTQSDINDWFEEHYDYKLVDIKCEDKYICNIYKIEEE